MFDKLSQFNALDITTASLISNDKELIESGSLLAFLDKVRYSLSAIEDNTILTTFDELHILGITRVEIEKKLDKLYDSASANEELRPSELLSLGELIGELNALNRYSKSLLYHQGIALRNEKVAKVRQLKTLTYQRVAKELYQIVVSRESYSTFDAWSIISSIDLFLRQYLNVKLVISEHKATQSLAKHIGLNLSKGKRSQQQVKQRDIVFSYLEKHFTSDCINLYESILSSGYQDITGISMPQDDRRLMLAYAVTDKLVKEKAFQSLKARISLDVLVNKIIKGLARKFRISSFDGFNEAIYISKLYSKIPSSEPFYYQKGNRAHKKLGSIQSGKLDEMISNAFEKTAFI